MLLSQEAVTSPHVRREISLAIDLGKDIFPLSMTPEYCGAGDLPGDWSYWLSLVQIYRFTNPSHTASIIQSRLIRGNELMAAAPVADPDERSDSMPTRTEPPAATSPVPSATKRTPSQEDRLRSILIDVAVSALTFEIALERGRKLGASAEDMVSIAYRLRDARLLSFGDELAPNTVIRLEQ